MKDISISFGGIKAVDHVGIDLYEGEVLGLVGHNGAGKTVLIKILSGALARDQGEIRINGETAKIDKPGDARRYGIETIYQNLALADNVDAAANLFLGRELLTRWGTLDDLGMEAKAREVMRRLNPRFERFHVPVRALSGGQRQSVAIARAILFDARILIMDEPTAALGPQESAQVADLIRHLTAQGISIILISHDMHDVFDLVDRVAVLKNGRLVGTARIEDVTADEVLGMIILGKCAPGAIPGPGALDDPDGRPAAATARSVRRPDARDPMAHPPSDHSLIGEAPAIASCRSVSTLAFDGPPAADRARGASVGRSTAGEGARSGREGEAPA